ncbi:hypothetical protein [Haloglomus halophilum]|uniref:hypothetical protein n=1 Tax=Haloglomus halophilum TaxID=2962672 RepID=UPI003313DC22
MIEDTELFAEPDPGFEESIRIDRDFDTEAPAERREYRYERYLDTYHLTDASVDFLEDLFTRIQDDNPDSEELNHWLYGYFGSGKSHLLTALDLLLDSAALAEEDMATVWNRFDSRADASDSLADTWRSLHEEYLIVPVPINLLRYQGVREQNFSEIILQTIYQRRGFSDRLDVAFFEEEFQRPGGLFDTQAVWEDREQLVNEILREAGVSDPEYDWAAVQRYRILSDLVLEGMTERATGMTENLADIQAKNIGQELAVRTLEEYRQELAARYDRPTKLVLLMDEVTLFMGDDDRRIGELNALAESIESVGGDILSVVTAQSAIEEAQPGTATKTNEIGWLKDRFPQQYALPSRHVGEIVQQRLLAKSPAGADWVRTNALEATVRPRTMLVYNDGNQNTTPPLDDIDQADFIDYYPLLPYQPALFLEILSNLRTELADRSKSIFSGTARAILALVAGLREEMARTDRELPIVSLVDFYDLIRYELEDIIPDETEVIETIAEDPATSAFDLKVAKAVLLLSYVPDLVPQNEANLAVAVMDDLDGAPRAQVRTQVREALDGELERYIRPDTATDGAKLRISTPDEQRMLADARERETDPDWDAIIEAVDQELWAEIIAELDLPSTYTYDDAADASAYPVGYGFAIDGQPLSTRTDEDAVFAVDVVIRGLRPDVDTDTIAEETLYWLLEGDGLDELRSQLVDWWALWEATQATTPPESVARDLDDAATSAISKLVAALEAATFRVEASSFSGFDAALEDYIDEAYPDYFHPELLRIDESHLRELERLDDDDALPEWAGTIGIPPASADIADISEIGFQVRKLVGSELQSAAGEIDLATTLDRVTASEPLFAVETNGQQHPSPALLAVLWGLCRAGVFRVVTIEGDPASVDDLLDTGTHPELALRPVTPGRRAKEVFVEHDLIPPTGSENRGYLELDTLLETTERRAATLAEDVTVQAETTFETDTLSTLVEALAEAAEGVGERAATRRSTASAADVSELEELVAGATDDAAWLETAQERWTKQMAYLLQLEGLVRLGRHDIAWLDDAYTEAIEALTEQLTSQAETEWWTQEGWRELVRSLDARETAIESLEASWTAQQEAAELPALRQTLAGHPWLLDPMELPDRSVHDGFRVQYLDPLRNTRSALERIEAAIEALTEREPRADDEERLTEALGRLDDLDWAAATTATADTQRELAATLESVVGERTPSEVTGIGVLHTDADALEAQLERLDLSEDRPEVVTVGDGQGVLIQ